MGVFSLNYHKHIHTGEGGLVTTDNAELAERLQLIRNHAEAVVSAKGVSALNNMVGFNYRLGEIEAAIGREQIKKAPALIQERLENVCHLEGRLAGLGGLGMPFVNPGSDHIYYKHTLSYNASMTGVPRHRLVEALRAELPVTRKREAEGPLIGAGYVKPLYLEPLYQSQTAFGSAGFPFRSPFHPGGIDYSRGICPNAEKAHFETALVHEMMRPGMSRQDLDDVASAFHKVWEAMPRLREG